MWLWPPIETFSKPIARSIARKRPDRVAHTSQKTLIFQGFESSVMDVISPRGTGPVQLSHIPGLPCYDRQKGEEDSGFFACGGVRSLRGVRCRGTGFKPWRHGVRAVHADTGKFECRKSNFEIVGHRSPVNSNVECRISKSPGHPSSVSVNTPLANQ